MTFVEKEDGMDAVATEFLDVSADGPEDGRRGRRRRQSQREAQLPVEVAPAQRGVVAIGEPETGLRQSLANDSEPAPVWWTPSM